MIKEIDEEIDELEDEDLDDEEDSEDGEEDLDAETTKALEEEEKKFRKAMEKFNLAAEPLLNKAQEAIDKLEELSEKYGIPFSSSVTPLYMTYTPESLHGKWSKLSEHDRLGDLLDEFELYENEYGGWEHSAVC